MKVFQRIATKDYSIEAQNGDKLEIKKGNVYTTSKVLYDHTVIVFTRFWCHVPDDIFEIKDDDKMTKPIAVVAPTITSGMLWINKNFKVKKFYINTGRFLLEDGRVLIVIAEPQHLFGYEFSDVMTTPDYESLLDLVKVRVR